VGWQPRLVRLGGALPGLEGARELRVRFVAEEEGQKRPVVEAVIDDVAVTPEAPACGAPVGAPGDGGAAPATASGDGCGCRVGGSAPGPDRGGLAGGATLTITAGLALRRARRRTRLPDHGGSRA
jgi:hypothetical protein